MAYRPAVVRRGASRLRVVTATGAEQHAARAFITRYTPRRAQQHTSPRTPHELSRADPCSRVAQPTAGCAKSEAVNLVGEEHQATKMRAAAIVALALGTEAFLKPAAPKAATQLAAYVPSGMSKAEYEALKKKVRTRCEKIRTGLVKKSAPPARSRRHVCTPPRARPSIPHRRKPTPKKRRTSAPVARAVSRAGRWRRSCAPRSGARPSTCFPSTRRR